MNRTLSILFIFSKLLSCEESIPIFEIVPKN